ncbi:hypothetical protein lbkm_2173 [Lachnospiraceae bacterium KM106-2]|nr:hypothetical protein lbkm_2173 [Lachnospiraceae bacterium KM106-2]
MNFAAAMNVVFPNNMWILLVVSLILCAVGFYKYVYFLSIGYGWAIAGEGIVMLLLYHTRVTPVIVLLCVLFVCYGVRLSGFLAYREYKSATYRKTLKKAAKTEKPMPFGVKCAIWIPVSFLYVAQVTPVYYRLANGTEKETLVPIIGALVMIAGLMLEGVADQQKSKQKKEVSNMVATKGLYSIVRCPNYFGEIVFWTGVLLSGCTILSGWGQWVIALTGYVCIVFIMFNGATRLEKRQEKNYGAKAEYQAYVSKTPILIPLVPLYHLAKQEEGANPIETKKKT